MRDQQIEQLERVADLTSEQAKGLLLEKVESEARHDMAVMLRDIEARAKDESEKEGTQHLIAGDPKMRGGSRGGNHDFCCRTAQR